jgi:hypothetical protein
MMAVYAMSNNAGKNWTFAGSGEGGSTLRFVPAFTIWAGVGLLAGTSAWSAQVEVADADGEQTAGTLWVVVTALRWRHDTGLT